MIRRTTALILILIVRNPGYKIQHAKYGGQQFSGRLFDSGIISRGNHTTLFTWDLATAGPPRDGSQQPRDSTGCFIRDLATTVFDGILCAGSGHLGTAVLLGTGSRHDGPQQTIGRKLPQNIWNVLSRGFSIFCDWFTEYYLVLYYIIAHFSSQKHERKNTARKTETHLV